MARRSIFISLWKARRRAKTGKVQKAVSLSVKAGPVTTAWVHLLCCKYEERGRKGEWQLKVLRNLVLVP